MKHPLRGFSTETILETVSRVEQHLGLNREVSSTVFHRLDCWLVSPDYFKRCFQAMGKSEPLVVVPYFASASWWKALGRVLKRYQFFTRIRAASCADAICVKNNVRAFYINRSDPFTLKPLLSKTRKISHLKNDVQSRAAILSFGNLHVPRILNFDFDFDPPFLCEELIFGRALRAREDATVITEQLCGPLWRTYDQHGIQFKTVGALTNLDEASQTLEALCRAHAWNSAWIDRGSFIEQTMKFLRSEGLIACSIGHGDLCLGNLRMSVDGRIYILDWECAGFMPIASDLLPLVNSVPETKAIFFAAMNKLARTMNPQILSAEEQFFFAATSHLLAYGRTEKLKNLRKFQRHLSSAHDFLKKRD